MKRGKDKLCKQCHKRPAKFSYKGEIRADKDHELCMQCFRSNSDSQAAINNAIRTHTYGFKPR
jgi:protein-arginine kinase activator protein McsA